MSFLTARSDDAEETGQCCPMRSWGAPCKAWQPRLLEGAKYLEGAACCPIASQKEKQVDAFPERGPNNGEETRKAVAPVAQMRLETQEHVDEQRAVDLPTDGIGAVSEESAEFEGLLDLLEEDFDIPSASVEIADAGRTPVRIVGDEYQQALLAVDFHPCLDAPDNPAPINLDHLVSDDFPLVFGQVAPHSEAHVVLGPGDPPDLPRVQISQVIEIHVRLVEYDDFPSFNAGSDFTSPLVVVFARGIYDGKGGQKAVQIQTQVHFGCRFAPAMLGPVNAVENEFHHCGIDRVDAHSEPAE